MKFKKHPFILLLALLILLPGCGASGNSGIDGDTSGDDDPPILVDGDDDDSNGEIDSDNETDGDDEVERESEMESDVIDPRFSEFVDWIETEKSQLNAPGVAVALIENGEVTFARGFGYKHVENKTPILPTTLFRLASVTKMLTSTGVLQQVEAGNVNLDAALNEYVTGFRLANNNYVAAQIRIRHLISNCAGISDTLDIDGEAAYNKDEGLEIYLTGDFGDRAYQMAPSGRFYNYSNPNFMLAGLVLEKAGGKFYNDYMLEDVFAPLGMNRTVFDPQAVLADSDYAFGYNNGFFPGVEAVMPPDAYDNYWARPCGYAFSSVLDMAEFVKFLMVGKPDFLAEEYRQAMQSAQISTKEMFDYVGYGFGLMVYDGFYLGQNFYKTKLVFHNGHLPGTSSVVFFLPELEIGYIALANASGAHFMDSFFGAVTSLRDPMTPATPPDLSVDPADYDDFVGDYSDPNNVGPIHVTKEGNALKMEMPLLDQYEIAYSPVLEPGLPDNFMAEIDGSPMAVTFIRDDAGKVEYFRTRYFVGVRDAETRSRPRKPMLDLEKIRRDALLNERTAGFLLPPELRGLFKIKENARQ